MDNELLYQLALTQIPHIGDVQAKILLQHYGSASDVFKAKQSELEKLEGIGVVRAQSIKNFNDFSVAQKKWIVPKARYTVELAHDVATPVSKANINLPRQEIFP